MEINKGRGNANKVMGRFLMDLASAQAQVVLEEVAEDNLLAEDLLQVRTMSWMQLFLFTPIKLKALPVLHVL